MYTLSYQQKYVENLDKREEHLMVIHRDVVQIVEMYTQYFVIYGNAHFIYIYTKIEGWKVLDEKDAVTYNKQEYSHVCVISSETASGGN